MQLCERSLKDWIQERNSRTTSVGEITLFIRVTIFYSIYTSFFRCNLIGTMSHTLKYTLTKPERQEKLICRARCFDYSL